MNREKLEKKSNIDTDVKLSSAQSKKNFIRFSSLNIPEEYIDLLISSGVENIEELSSRKPTSLLKQITETNEKKKFVRRLPTLKDVKSWISNAENVRALNQQFHIIPRNPTQNKPFNVSKIIITSTFEGNNLFLTPDFLSNRIVPIIFAFSDIQEVFNNINNKNFQEVRISEITNYSPISISLDGVADAIKLIFEMIIPWKKKHSERMAMLDENEKIADIELKKAELLEKRSNALRNRAEANKHNNEALKLREEAEKLRLENQSVNHEMEHQRILLALDIVNKISDKLAEEEKYRYVIKLLNPIEVLTNIDIETIIEQ